jgi:DNA-binding winged helix-turn-helix (wHTH) protein
MTMSLPDLSPAPGYAARYTFLDFALLPCERALLHADSRVALGSRAYDVLLALVERAGRLVTKEELIAVVWPDTIVEEGNLRVQISALRKALREEQHGRLCIENLARRGYIFSAPVRRHGGMSAATAERAATAQAAPAPFYDNLVGRDADLRELTAILAVCHYVAITGAAGVGKSVLAAAVAARVALQWRLPYCMLDAADCPDLNTTLRAIAVAVRLPQPDGADAALLAHGLRDAIWHYRQPV